MEQERSRPVQSFGPNDGIPQRIEDLEVNKFVALMAWADQSKNRDELGEPLDEWVWHDAMAAHPELVADIYRALADHPLPGLRRTAALGLRRLYLVDREASMNLWPRLLSDTDEETKEFAEDDLARAVGEHILSIGALYRIFSALHQETT